MHAGKGNVNKLVFIATKNNHESQPFNRLHKARGRSTCIASFETIACLQFHSFIYRKHKIRKLHFIQFWKSVIDLKSIQILTL